MKDLKIISIDRKTLYDEIWENSLHKTAEKYNISDIKLKEACITAEIPLPTLSYWGKKNMEMDVSADIVPLPASEKTMVEVVVKTVRKAVNPDRKKKQTKEIMPKQNLPQIDE